MLSTVRERLTFLGVAQLVTLTMAFTTLIFAVLLLHHQTADYFTPLPSYLQSIKIALPPAAIFVATYAIAFLAGIAIGDVPKAVLAYARNRFFQSLPMMTIAVIAMTAVCSYAARTITSATPPSYEGLVRLILSGSSDNLQLAKERVAEIKRVNPELAAKLGKVVEVFVERNAVNSGAKPLSGERARILVRMLEVFEDDDWLAHPLRKHALAEAYLLFGQSAEQAGQIAQAASPADRNPYQVGIEHYEDVWKSLSPLATEQLRLSARNNIGNAYYYMRDPKRALAAWRSVMEYGEGKNNLGVWGNIIAALVLSDQSEEAVREGESARVWAEKSGKAFIDTFQFASILENTGFARLRLKQYEAALKDFAAAHAFREDDLTRQNLAIALVIAGRYTDAQKLLRRIAPPVDEKSNSSPDPKIANCVYLIWALALKEASFAERAANLMSFLGERYSAQEMQAFDANRMKQLLARVSEALPKSADPCASISRIEAVTALLRM